MDELRRFIAAGELRKAAVLLEAQLADAGRRLTKIEAEDARRRSFWDATVKAPIVANFHPAPRSIQ
jgi:hypothetical protein